MREKDHKEKRRGEGCLCLGFGEERRGEEKPSLFWLFRVLNLFFFSLFFFGPQVQLVNLPR